MLHMLRVRTRSFTEPYLAISQHNHPVGRAFTPPSISCHPPLGMPGHAASSLNSQLTERYAKLTEGHMDLIESHGISAC